MLVTALLLVGLAGCANAPQEPESAVGAAREPADHDRFCLSVTRTIAAVESGTPHIAQDAIEEAITQSPEQLLEGVRGLAARIRAADQAGPEAVDDPELAAAARGLREQVVELCDRI